MATKKTVRASRPSARTRSKAAPKKELTPKQALALRAQRMAAPKGLTQKQQLSYWKREVVQLQDLIKQIDARRAMAESRLKSHAPFNEDASTLLADPALRAALREGLRVSVDTLLKECGSPGGGICPVASILRGRMEAHRDALNRLDNFEKSLTSAT